MLVKLFNKSSKKSGGKKSGFFFFIKTEPGFFASSRLGERVEALYCGGGGYVDRGHRPDVSDHGGDVATGLLQNLSFYEALLL